MTGLPKRYLFHSRAQWRAGLVTGGLLGADGLTTAPRLAAAPVHIWDGDAYAPARDSLARLLASLLHDGRGRTLGGCRVVIGLGLAAMTNIAVREAD